MLLKHLKTAHNVTDQGNIDYNSLMCVKSSTELSSIHIQYVKLDQTFN